MRNAPPRPAEDPDPDLDTQELDAPELDGRDAQAPAAPPESEPAERATRATPPRKRYGSQRAPKGMIRPPQETL